MILIKLLSKIAHEQGGFLLQSDIHQLAELDRLRQLLVRCGNCRFVTAAQDVGWITAIITRDGTDYVRDVSLLASDAAYSISPPAAQPVTQPESQIKTDRDYIRMIVGSNSLEDAWSDADPGL